MKIILLCILSIGILTISAFAQTLVQDINPGLGGGEPSEKVIYNGDLYFGANDGVNGYELWKYDGITATMVQDIHPTGNSYPQNFVVAGGILYFSAYDGISGRELWKFDGITASLVQDIFPGISSNAFDVKIFAWGNSIYFNANDGINGEELWKYDGANLTLFDINPGSQTSYPSGFTEYNGNLYFVADDGTNGRELWKYDGTNLTIIDINAGVAPSLPYFLTNYNSELYFRANNGLDGFELMKYDGNTVSLVQDIYPAGSSFPDYFFVHNNQLFFRAQDDVNGFELWKFDVTTATMVQDINPNGDSEPIQFTTLGTDLYFVADDGVNGRELWKYDGTTVSLVEDINTSGHSMPSQSNLEEATFLTVLGQHLYFTAEDGTNGFQLWKYDGNTTTQIIINPDQSDAYPYEFIIFNNELYFTAYDHPVYGSELWKVTGSFASIENNGLNTHIQIYPNPTSSILNIQSDEKIDEIVIMDYAGKIIETISNATISIDVSHLPNGVYFIQLKTSNGVLVKQFVKK